MADLKRLYDSKAVNAVISYLMKNPQKLTGTKYLLTLNDFVKPLHSCVFGAISNMAYEGAKIIHPNDIDVYLSQYGTQYAIFTKDNGLVYLHNLKESEVCNDESVFELLYNRVKKFTVLRDLELQGISSLDFFNPNVDILNFDNEIKKLDSQPLTSFLDAVRVKLAKIEKININKDGNYLRHASDGLKDMVKSYREEPLIGLEMEGQYLNFSCRGARPGTLYMFSAPQAGGKTTFLISQACKFALPYIKNGQLIIGDLKKVYYLATEQDPEELQVIMLAYVSGVERQRIKTGKYMPGEYELVMKATDIIEQYSDNLIFDRVPSPNIAQVKSLMVEQILEKNVEVVIYDYLAISFDIVDKHFRTDQVLMMFSNELKEIAISYKVFVLTATQLSDSLGESFLKPVIRTQSLLRDAKSLSDKTDLGVIGCRLSYEELEKVLPIIQKIKCPQPNYVKDIYKNRDCDLTAVKIFSYFDFGTGRTDDLFITKANYTQEEVGVIDYDYTVEEVEIEREGF